MVPFTQEQAARLGFNMQIYSGIENETMISIVDQMVATNNTGVISSVLKVSPESDSIARQYLIQLQNAFELLPHNTDTSPKMIGYAFMITLTIVVIMARVLIRLKIHGRLRPDDYAAVIACATVSVTAGIYIAQSAMNILGVHIWDLPLDKIRFFFKTLLVSEFFFVLNHFLVKATFLFFYYNLGPTKIHQLCVKVAGVFVVVTFVAFEVVLGMQCMPVDEWNHFGTTKCLDRLKAFSAMAYIYIFIDTMILVIPTATVWRLPGLKTNEKIIISGMFASGVLIVASSVVRVFMLRIWFRTVDFTYSSNPHGIVGLLELCLSLIISSFPAIYKGFLHWTHRSIDEKVRKLKKTSGNYDAGRNVQRSPRNQWSIHFSTKGSKITDTFATESTACPDYDARFPSKEEDKELDGQAYVIMEDLEENATCVPPQGSFLCD